MLEKCRSLGFTPEIFAIDSDQDACTSIRSHQDLPDDHIIQKDTVDGVIGLIEYGVEPGLVTLTNYFPFSNYSVTDMITKLTKLLPAKTRLLITCADDNLEEFERVLSLFNSHHPAYSHLKLLLGEKFEDENQGIKAQDKNVLFIEVEKPAASADLSKYARARPSEIPQAHGSADQIIKTVKKALSENAAGPKFAQTVGNILNTYLAAYRYADKSAAALSGITRK